jgi:hypothetical protein
VRGNKERRKKKERKEKKRKKERKKKERKQERRKERTSTHGTNHLVREVWAQQLAVEGKHRGR